jgi:molybdopterin synthase catalytic subunit
VFHTRLQAGPFVPAQEIAQVAKASQDIGGLASFTGYVRAKGGAEALELSHYEPLTLPGMKALSYRAQTRFELIALTIIHRTGMMVPGDPIVCVAAASVHRRDAILAADFCMDHLKSAAWFWKRELRAGQWHWIEPRAEDHSDLARWD